MKLFLKASFIGSLAATVVFFGTRREVFAEETVVEKVQSGSENAVKETKQGARKVKKKVRNATGNSSIKEDIKDSAANAGDEIEHQAKKTKRKID